MTDTHEKVGTSNEDNENGNTFNEPTRDAPINQSISSDAVITNIPDELLLNLENQGISSQQLILDPQHEPANVVSAETQLIVEDNLKNDYANGIKVTDAETSTTRKIELSQLEISQENIIEVPLEKDTNLGSCIIVDQENAELSIKKNICITNADNENTEEVPKDEVQEKLVQNSEDDVQETKDEVHEVIELHQQCTLVMHVSPESEKENIISTDDKADDTSVSKEIGPKYSDPVEFHEDQVNSSNHKQQINSKATSSYTETDKIEDTNSNSDKQQSSKINELESENNKVGEPTNSDTNTEDQETPEKFKSKCETINVPVCKNANTNDKAAGETPEKLEPNCQVVKINETTNNNISIKEKHILEESEPKLERCTNDNNSNVGEGQLISEKTGPKSETVRAVESKHTNSSQDAESPKPVLQGNNANQPVPSRKGIMQLEQMSHEDLLKQCKRQLLFLQKTKMKNDDLTRTLQELQNENIMLKESSTKPGVSGELLRSLQSENDHLLDEKESQAEVVAQLNKDILKLVSDLATCKEQMEENKGLCNQLKESLSTAATEKKLQDAVVLELQSQIIIMRSERISDTKKMGEKHSEVEFLEAKCSSLQSEVEAKAKECLDLQTSINQLKQELEQEKVLNLEIRDYERTLRDLNEQLAMGNKTVEDLNVQLLKMKDGQDVLQKEIGHLEHQCISEESRSSHLKEILETTRQQLASKCEEYDKLSSALAESKRQKEDILASKEELQYQLSISSNNLLVLENEFKQNRDQSEKQDLSLKSRISSLTEELSEARQQLEASRKEFHSYKVRVHSVLKQQKVTGSTSGQPVSNLPVNDDEQKGQMEWTLELCKGKIAQLMEQLSTLTVERDSLQKEQEWILSKHNLLTQQMQEKEESLLQRLEESVQELDLSRSLWETEKQQLLQQQKNVMHEYDHRLSSLEAEHERHVSTLVIQLEQLQRNASVFNSLSVDQTSTPQGHSHRSQIYDLLPAAQLSASVDESFDICSQERQEGEGSECTDPLPVPAAFQTLVTSPASGFMPLERLLQAEPTSNYGNQDPEMIAITINTLQKKVDHISELLNESEASNLRLSEQTRLLKEEIRRLERNTERHEHFNNLEYLKNVVLKFNTTPNGSERERLVPVISTLLRLSPEEQAQMKQVSNQDAGNSNGNAGWGNYLHRWSGLV